jgi:hypothetical protein
LTQSAQFLLSRAEKCRELARQASSRQIAEELEKLAADYDQEASQAERSGFGRRD